VDISLFVFRETPHALEIYLSEEDAEPTFVISNEIIAEGRECWESALYEFVKILGNK
jgi:hypothetical protein